MAQNFLTRAARRVAAVIAECHEARRRSVTLALAPDRQLITPDSAPETYPEFLLRTRAPLLHEPPARDRAQRRVALPLHPGVPSPGLAGTGSPCPAR